MLDAQFGVATAVGLFKSAISMFFLSISYWLAYKIADYRIFRGVDHENKIDVLLSSIPLS